MASWSHALQYFLIGFMLTGISGFIFLLIVFVYYTQCKNELQRFNLKIIGSLDTMTKINNNNNYYNEIYANYYPYNKIIKLRLLSSNVIYHKKIFGSRPKYNDLKSFVCVCYCH